MDGTLSATALIDRIAKLPAVTKTSFILSLIVLRPIVVLEMVFIALCVQDEKINVACCRSSGLAPLSVADILRVVEIARVLVRFDHVACFIINANHGIM
jgi:hypothetical protein